MKIRKELSDNFGVKYEKTIGTRIPIQKTTNYFIFEERKMSKEEQAIMMLAKAIEDGRASGVVEDAENILIEDE